MYSLNQLVAGVRTPRIGLRELNRLYWDRGGRRSYNPEGVDVFAAEWDNLVILDGCRYDVYADVVGDYAIEGEVESRTSRGAATMEWLRGNFDGRSLLDVVYVTASTMLYQEDVFRDAVDVELHDTVDVWADGIAHGEDGVPPEAVAERAREAVEAYPEKRLVVHFVQPHAPYLGERGREVFDEYRPNPLSARFQGLLDVPAETFREVYEENLRLALEAVEDLLADLPGRTVISADHGMLLGERERPIPVRSFGHPSRLYVDEMVEVPWHVVDDGERKRVVAEPAAGSYEELRDEDLDERAREHLRQLGYA